MYSAGKSTSEGSSKARKEFKKTLIYAYADAHCVFVRTITEDGRHVNGLPYAPKTTSRSSRLSFGKPASVAAACVSPRVPTYTTTVPRARIPGCDSKFDDITVMTKVANLKPVLIRLGLACRHWTQNEKGREWPRRDPAGNSHAGAPGVIGIT
jgi:hypothetical protein